MARAKTHLSSKGRTKTTAKREAIPTAASGDTRARASERYSELTGLVIVGIALIIGAAMWSFTPADLIIVHTGHADPGQLQNLTGPVGARLADLLLQLFGVGAWGLDLGLLWVGARTLLGRQVQPNLRTSTGLFGAVVSGLILLHLLATGLTYRPWGKDAAGLIGSTIAEVLRALLSTTGSTIIALMLLFTAISALTNKPLISITARGITRWGVAIWRRLLGQTRQEAGSRLSAWRAQRELQSKQRAEAKAEAREQAKRDKKAEAERKKENQAKNKTPEVERAETKGGKKGLAPMPDIFREGQQKDEGLSKLSDTRRLSTSSPQNPKIEVGEDGFPIGTSLQPSEDIVPTAVRLARQRDKTLAKAEQDAPTSSPPPHPGEGARAAQERHADRDPYERRRQGRRRQGRRRENCRRQGRRRHEAVQTKGGACSRAQHTGQRDPQTNADGAARGLRFRRRVPSDGSPGASCPEDKRPAHRRDGGPERDAHGRGPR